MVDGAPQAHVSKIINSLQPLEIQEMIKMSVCLLFLDGVKNYKFVNIKLDFRPSQTGSSGGLVVHVTFEKSYFR